MDEQTAAALREHLVESNFKQVLDGYQAAIKGGEKNPVVFLLDCEDPIGGEIARAWEGDEAVDEAILDAQHEQPSGDAASEEGSSQESTETRTTILVRAFPFADCREEIPEVFPYLAESFQEEPAAGNFLVIVVAAEGAATFTAPVE